MVTRHTLGHICYYATEGDQKAVFTGDTLFVGGAGRFFEGTPEELQHSLGDKLGKLPPETLVYCGHEASLCVQRAVLCRGMLRATYHAALLSIAIVGERIVILIVVLL